MMKIEKKLLLLLAVFVFFIPLLYAGIRLNDVYAERRTEPPAESSQAPAPPAEPEPEPEPPARVTLFAAGDDLIHDVLYNQARARSGGDGYDFRPVYSRLLDRIQGADIAFINQETIMAASFSPSSYPAFNSPQDLAHQLAEMGFDVVNLANNHMLDWGTAGLLETIDLLDSIPQLTRIGAYRGPEEKETTAVVEKNGVSFAFVGFAEYTNAYGTSGAPELTVYTNDIDAVTRQITAARKLADVVVVSVHFGTENTTQPDQRQYDAVRLFSSLGADIVLGHHSHVIQPIEVIRNEEGRSTLVFYSLGNFVSGQRSPYNLVGLAPEITVEKDPRTGAVTVLPPVAHPIVTHYEDGMRDIQIYPVGQYTQELASAHGVRATDGGAPFSLTFIQELVQSVVPPEYLG